MTYISGQPIIYWQQVKSNPAALKPLEATFLKYIGQKSARVAIKNDVEKTVRLDSLEVPRG